MNLAELCAKVLYDQCSSIKERTNLVYLKGTKKPTDPFEHFFDGEDHWHLNYSCLPDISGRKGIWRKDSLLRKAWLYFNENDEKIVDLYVRKRWGNDLRKAMTEVGSYSVLHEDFLQYFADRREKFLEQTEQAIEQAKASNLSRMKMPSSHGGVANLLKVLTKTMIAQGSSILTIAKVQYTICVQAGIMLPNEFLTDVLVVDEMMEGKA